MNSKNISKALNAKLSKWVETIDDKDVVKTIKENALITGGAIVSLLNGEIPNDYDVYFKTLESCEKVTKYYANKWNNSHIGQKTVEVKIENDRIQCFIKSIGAVIEDGENAIDDNTEPYATENIEEPTKENPEIEKPKYRPRYFSTNAISLSDGIQIVIRFWGPVEEIHKNYDFEHCKCSYDWNENKVDLPVKALECIINKELYYSGSKYPLCSIIRTRKFISRGWTINAGQYVKMALQLNELDLKDLNVFKEQLVGVDSAYFSAAIEAICKKQENEPDFKIDNNYLFEIINRIF
jgi:hypothetical protein